MSRTFALKVGVLPDRVLITCLNDRLIAKGAMRDFSTDLFADFLTTESLPELMSLLRKAKLEGRLIELFPANQRTDEDFAEHFKVGGVVLCGCCCVVVWWCCVDFCVQVHPPFIQHTRTSSPLPPPLLTPLFPSYAHHCTPLPQPSQAAGIQQLVEYNKKKMEDQQLEALTGNLSQLMVSEPPAPASECVALVTSKIKDAGLPPAEVVKVLFFLLLGIYHCCCCGIHTI